MSLREKEQQVQEAERQLARHQQRITRPGSTLEDEVYYERARTRLALSQLALERAARQADRRAYMERDRARTPPEADAARQRPMTARERAEATFNLPRKGRGE